MKKPILILLCIFSTTILHAQEGDSTSYFEKFRNPVTYKYYDSDKDSLYQNVQTLQQFVFNVAVSYQMYANIKIKEDKYLKPGILLNNKPVPLDSLKNIPWNKVKNLEFKTGEVKALFPSIAHSGVFFIETK